MTDKNKVKTDKITQKFGLEVRFIPLPLDEVQRRSNRLQELLFKGARKCAQNEEREKAK
jgi:hypothetical protein